MTPEEKLELSRPVTCSNCKEDFNREEHAFVEGGELMVDCPNCEEAHTHFGYLDRLPSFREEAEKRVEEAENKSPKGPSGPDTPSVKEERGAIIEADPVVDALFSGEISKEEFDKTTNEDYCEEKGLDADTKAIRGPADDK